MSTKAKVKSASVKFTAKLTKPIMLPSTSSTSAVSKIRSLLAPRPDVLRGYASSKEVNQYLDYLGERYPSFVKVHTLGLSHEERPIRAIEIDWSSPKNSAQESAAFGEGHSSYGRNYVFIEGGAHGREWISVAVALHCISQLTEKRGRHQELLRKLRFYIVPLSNPDGYDYSRTKNRRWRKNRRPHKCSLHVGTDCNRNWDFHWEEGSGIKLNLNTYKGERPFSEPETSALSTAMRKLGPNLLLVLSLHSYAQSIMYPWGYSKDLPESWEQLHAVATAGRNAIKSFSGRPYRVGSIATLTKRKICGSIVDYAFGELRVPIALVIELPSFGYGFYPPSHAISPIGSESWCGIREMCNCAHALWSEKSKDHCDLS